MLNNDRLYDAAGGVRTPAAPGPKNEEDTKGKVKVIYYCGDCQIGYVPTLTPLSDNKECLECKKTTKEIGWIEYG